MKKFVLALLAMASVGVANAQKGSILLYGNAGIHTNKVDNGGGNENKDFNWNVNPGVGYQFTDNITLGVQGGFMSMRNTVKSAAPASETKMVMNEFQAGIFARFGMKINNMFTLYDQLDLSYVGGKSTTDVEVGGTSVPQVINNEYNGFQASLTPALQMFVKDGMALNFSFGGLQYRTITTDVPTTVGGVTTNVSSTTSSFDFTMWRQFNVGISYNIGKGCCKRGGGHAKPGDDLRPMTNSSDDDDE